MARALIAVVGSLEARAGEPELVTPVVYLDAVRRAGGTPVVLHPAPIEPGRAADDLARFDALLLIGGGDLDPETYGERPGVELYGVSQVRDAYEFAMLGAAAARGLRVLAICRGLQVANVARGGTLQQHIGGREDLAGHGTPNGGEPNVHAVTIRPGTWLAEIMAADTVIASCHHHQAVAVVGAGLERAAATSDGLVEALESESGDLIAVQWHPEDTAARDPAQQRLFDWLVNTSPESPPTEGTAGGGLR